MDRLWSLTIRHFLSALRSQPHVVSAFLFDNEGHLFASYTTPNGPKAPATVPHEGSQIDLDGISVAHAVKFNGKPAGTLWLRSDLSELAALLAAWSGGTA